MSQIPARAQWTTKRYAVVHDAKVIPLRPGEGYLIGRSPEAKIVLEDHMVSRRHARLLVSQNVLIEDLGSANGVFVNGKRIGAYCQVRPGQRIQIGKQELVLRELPGQGRATLATLPERSSSPSPEPAVSSDCTDQLNFAAVLLELGGRMLAAGRGAEAEQLLERHLMDELSCWRNNNGADAKHAELCAERALELATATGKAAWLDYVFDLYAAMDALLPDQLINQSYQVVRRVRRPSLHTIRGYLRRVEARQQSLGPSERFLLNRLHGLEQMAMAR